MQINKYTDIVGAVVVEDIPEGRMVLITSNTVGTKDFGSEADLPGVKLPDDSTEAGEAKFIVTWPVTNANAEGPIKLFIPTPSMDWALRRGFDQAANVPFNADVHLSWPGNKDGVTIPSGYQALAFAEGVFTVPSGSWEYNVALEAPGAPLRVMDTSTDSEADAGRLAYNGGGGTTVARVERYHSDTGDLTFRTLNA